MKHIGAIAANYESSTRSNEFISIAKSLMLGRGRASDAAAVAPSERVAKILKGAVAGGSTSGTGWAEEIAPTEQLPKVLLDPGPVRCIRCNHGGRRLLASADALQHQHQQLWAQPARPMPKRRRRQSRDLHLRAPRCRNANRFGMVVITDELLKNSTPAAFNFWATNCGAAWRVQWIAALRTRSSMMTPTSRAPPARLECHRIGRGSWRRTVSNGDWRTSRIYAIMPPSTVKVAALLRGSTGGPTFPRLAHQRRRYQRHYSRAK